MEKVEYQFDDFLSTVVPEYREFATQVHQALLQDGYKTKIESKANGFLVSYSHPKTKRTLLNFLFRKNGLLVRLYADNFAKYDDFMQSLPPAMEKEIAKASVCKRLVNPEQCNPKCVMGYDFSIRGSHYQKCRYSCFQFAVNDESIPALLNFVANERKERQVG